MILLSQRKYVHDLLIKTGKMGIKPCSTPMVPDLYFTKNDGDPFDDRERYKRLVGKLNYLTVTCSDSTYVVSIVSQFMFTPTVKHLEDWEQILGYLNGAPDLGIVYKITNTPVANVLRMLIRPD